MQTMAAAESHATDSVSETKAVLLPFIAVLIPAYRPTRVMVALAHDLSRRGFARLVIVDDGSGAEFRGLFDELEASPGILVLRHAVNLGKGRALKNGFNALLQAGPHFTGVVTADADGQHAPEDIERVARALLGSGARAVLGCRGFDREVPWRSRLGNSLTRAVFAAVTGKRVADTQTGLRGLPLAMLPDLMTLTGERYEYEMTMLAWLCRGEDPPVEIPIATIYLENNRGSHFNPVWDSMRIYFVLVRFYASSLLAAGLDLVVFAACFALTHRVLLSVVVGRLSAVVNYAINRSFVFRSGAPVARSLLRYAVLAVAIASTSFGLIQLLAHYAHWNVLAAKVAADVLLSLISFSVQRTFVFRRGTSI